MVNTRSRKPVREKGRPEKPARVRDDAHSAVKEIHGYSLICKVGQGGMGAVFKARQNSLDREVALKILPPKIAADRSFIERFRNEARASAKLCHPNIVQGIDVGHDERSGLWYFSMEFINGPSVKALIQNHGAIREREALRIAGEVARALTAVNHAGLVHRDIKPDNILLTSAGEVKVADLGLTRDLTNDAADMTSVGQAVGTPHYMSPEQVRGSKDVDIRADLYALGATLYHMVTAASPFDGETNVDIMSKHLHAPPPHARSANADVSEECERLIVKLMAKKPEDRYQTPEKVLRDIESLLSASNLLETSEPAEETVVPDPSRKHASRNRTPALMTSRTGISAQSRSPLKPAAAARGVAWYMYAALSIPFMILAAAMLASNNSTHAATTASLPEKTELTPELKPESKREIPALPASAPAPQVEAPVPPPIQPSLKHVDAVMHPAPAIAPAASAGVWWEAEDATQQDFVSHVWLADQLDKRNLSGRKYLSHLNDPNWWKFPNHKVPGSVHATFTVDVPADGTYTLWVREYDPYSAAPWKFRWDDRSWFSVPVDYPWENKIEIGKDRWLVWRKYPNQTLTKGKHTFKLEAAFDDRKIFAAYDCFYLTTGAFRPNGVAKP